METRIALKKTGIYVKQRGISKFEYTKDVLLSPDHVICCEEVMTFFITRSKELINN